MRRFAQRMGLAVMMYSLSGFVATIQAKANTVDTTSVKPYQSISTQIGITGPRLYYNRSIGVSHRFMLRAGVQYVAYRKPIRIKVDKGSYLTLSPDFMIGLAEAGLRWQVFKNGPLYLVTGLAYNWHPALQVTLTAENKLNLGGLELTPADVGVVDLGFQWQRLMPYIGVGLGKPLPRRRLSVGVEMGVFYMGSPRVLLNYEGFLETTTIDEQVPIVERNLSGYRYLPSVNVTLTYRLP